LPGAREREVLLFEDLVARHVDLAHHVALAWTRDAAAADDLTQEAFMKAWRAFGSFRAGTNFKAWILAILRNAFLDRQRALAARPDRVPMGAITTAEEPEAPIPAPRAIDIENREIFYDVFGDQVARLLHRMPSEYQVAVLLCDVEGMTYPEIAGALGVPVGTVRSRIHRGRALLSEHLRDYARQVGYLKERSP
jgi:RNA polymerase sigma-70 factor (ECF subfamily)